MTSIHQLLLVFGLFSSFGLCDDYVEELRTRCNSTSQSHVCTKYRLFDYVDHVGFSPETTSRALGGFVRLVKIEGKNYDVGLFENSRYFGDDDELMKIIKFLQRKAVRYLEGQAMSFALPEGAEVVDADATDLVDDEARRKKGGGKKKEMLIPLIMLFKLFKIKVLVSLVLLSVLFIKKTILLTAMFLPSVIQSIKNHCKTSYHVVPHHIEEEHHEHDVSGTGWGYPGYGNEIERRRIQRAPYRRIFLTGR